MNNKMELNSSSKLNISHWRHQVIKTTASNKSFSRSLAALGFGRGHLSLLLAINLLLVLLNGQPTIGQDSSAPAQVSNNKNELTNQQQQQQPSGAAAAAGAAQVNANTKLLEAELNSMLEQHEAQEANRKLLSEAIISRLMLGNLSGPSLLNVAEGVDEFEAATQGGAASEWAPDSDTSAGSIVMPTSADDEYMGREQTTMGPRLSGPELVKLKKLMGFLQSYEQHLNGQNDGINGGQVFSQYPILPAGQAATMKRTASIKMGNYLNNKHQQQRQMNGYQRNTFDFGLGKRPDGSVANNILRFGDSSLGLGGGGGSHVQAVAGQFGKRPSAHRYDFGLGKRVASPTYPRYDFGLGKRAPNKIRYDFGLGKK